MKPSVRISSIHSAFFRQLTVFALLFVTFESHAINSLPGASSNIEFVKLSSSPGLELYEGQDEFGRTWIKLKTEVKTPYWSLLNLLRDTESATEWVHNVAEVTLMETPNAYTDVVHTVMKAPWPFSDREMFTMSNIAIEEATKQMHIQIWQTDRYPATPKYQMMQHVEGVWSAQQLDDDFTEISWLGTGVAGGNIPDWLSISEMKSSTQKTFNMLRKKISEKKYQAKPSAYLRSTQNPAKQP